MIDAFLTDDDLRRLTGRPRRAEQRRYLEREAIPYRINDRGQIVVSWSAVNGQREVRRPLLGTVR